MCLSLPHIPLSFFVPRANSGRRLAPARPLTMARTMGEVLPSSFTTLYSLAPRPPAANRGADGDGSPAPATLFVDVGSGYGTLCVAAVQEYGFGAAVGIEKYR